MFFTLVKTPFNPSKNTLVVLDGCAFMPVIFSPGFGKATGFAGGVTVFLPKPIYL